jgi:MoxR-like ATPase
VTAMDIAAVGAQARRVLDEVERAVVGKRDVVQLMLLALLCEGHVLVEDVPGLAKTLMASSLAHATGLRFTRIQFTPDLMPSDVTGSSLYDQRSGEFRFLPGPVFTNLLLADEINRAPAKTQAALLEAMQERQVTTEGRSDPLPRPFVVVATQNPIEFEGTYPLPEAQLDRFLMRISVGYPSREDEAAMVRRRAGRGSDDVDLAAVVDAPALLDMQAAVERVHVDDAIAAYVVDVAASTRVHPSVGVGASPRGSLALLKLSRAHAALSGRDFVTPDDVKAIAIPALAHRLTLKPELWVQRVRTEDVVEQCLRSVATPVRVEDT